MSLKSFIDKILQGIEQFFKSLTKETQELLPILQQIVQKIKTIEDTGAPDLLASLIPAGLPEKINNAIKAALPVIMDKLNTVQSIAAIADPEQRLLAIIENIKLSSNEAQNNFWHGLATLLLSTTASENISWGDSSQVNQWYYDNVFKPSLISTDQPAPAVNTTNV